MHNFVWKTSWTNKMRPLDSAHAYYSSNLYTTHFIDICGYRIIREILSLMHDLCGQKIQKYFANKVLMMVMSLFPVLCLKNKDLWIIICKVVYNKIWKGSLHIFKSDFFCQNFQIYRSKKLDYAFSFFKKKNSHSDKTLQKIFHSNS